MALPLESVPNFSEGRDRGTIDAIGAALGAHAELLDVHADEDHNRTVFTLVGEEWMPDSDLLTPTSKLKRRGINVRYAGEIEAMYADRD